MCWDEHRLFMHLTHLARHLWIQALENRELAGGFWSHFEILGHTVTSPQL